MKTTRKPRRLILGSFEALETGARDELSRAGYTTVSTPGYPIKYFAFSDKLQPTSQRESWQEVLADVNTLNPISFALVG